MSGPQPEPPADAQAPFDPFRRRKEIEELERRFRAKLAQSSSGPVSTGEIERKVSEEMREFFSASEAHLLQVVPALESASHGSLQETTGEMRARIDDFFSEVGGDPPRPATRPSAVPVKEARGPRVVAPVEMVVENDAETDAPAAPRPEVKPEVKPDRGAARPAARAGSASRTSKSRTGVPARGAPTAPGAGPSRKSPSSETGASSKPKLDLKTALERLRKHGGGRGAPVVNFAAAAQPEHPAAPESSPASPPASASASSAEDASAAPAASARPAPSRDTGSQDATSSQDLQSPKSSSSVASPPAASSTGKSPGTSSVGAPSTGPASSDTADPAARTQHGPVLSPLAQLQAAKTAAERAAAEKALTEKAEAEKAEAEAEKAEAAEQSPAPPVPAAKSPAEKTPVPRRAAEAALLSNVPVAEPLPPAVVANVIAQQEIRWQKEEQTQSILPPLQREPRTGPIAGVPTFERRKEQTTSGRERSRRSGNEQSRADSARTPMGDPGRSQLPPIGWGGSAPETSRKPQTGGGTSAPTTGSASGAVRLGRARSLSTIDDVSIPMAPRAPDRGETFDEIFDELQGLVLETLKESVDETMHEAKKSEDQLRPRETRPTASPSSAPPSAAAAARAGAAAPAKPLRLAKPTDDDEDEDAQESREQAPAEPYQWGVQPAPRPAGAWLVGDEAAAATAGKPAKPAKPAQAAQPSEPAPAPAAAPAKDAREVSAGAGLGVGGRAYLIKKAADEVKRIQPVMDSLVRKGVVKPEELADPAAPAPRKGSDDELSVDSFADRPRVDLEKELSPVRLVEELRRIRRLTDALLAKGVVTQDDLNRIAE